VGRSDVAEIEPMNDRMVIFGSRTVHSVKPTKSPARFGDGRFSLNIWVGRRGKFDSDNQMVANIARLNSHVKPVHYGCSS